MTVQKKCEALFRKDYQCSFIRNTTGVLCSTYPFRLIYIDRELPESERDSLNVLDVIEEQDEMSEAAREVYQKIQEGALARHKKRFPISVMMCNGKHICRCATPAATKELATRCLDIPQSSDIGEASSSRGSPSRSTESQSTPSPLRKRRRVVEDASNVDIALIKAYDVSHICDLVSAQQHALNFKFLLRLSPFRSEVPKSTWYSKHESFTILQLPYPAFSVFKKYSVQGTGYKLEYKWSMSDNFLCIPPTRPCEVPDVEWREYRDWDLDTLTRNYLRLLLSVVCKGEGGVLIECAQGIDRTPLLVSLLRISLWADGRIHKSLMPIEIAYLVLAYDWYLFGHLLPDRIGEGEEVLMYCFRALGLIMTQDCCSHSCINTFFHQNIQPDFPPGQLPTSQSVDVESGSMCDMATVQPAHRKGPNVVYDKLFDDATDREMAKMSETPREIPVPKEVPEEKRDTPAVAIISSILEGEVENVLSLAAIRSMIEKCRCYLKVPLIVEEEEEEMVEEEKKGKKKKKKEKKEPIVLTWRNQKLQIVQNIFTLYFSIAAGRSILSVHSKLYDNPDDEDICNRRRNFLNSLANLTIARFGFRDLCGPYRRFVDPEDED